MTRNKAFRRRYTIEIKGITTNNFLVEQADGVIGGIVDALASRYAQLEVVKYKAEDLRDEQQKRPKKG